jgi:hypothetical protein
MSNAIRIPDSISDIRGLTATINREQVISGRACYPLSGSVPSYAYTPGGLTVAVNDASGFPNDGTFTHDGVAVTYVSKSGNSLLNCTVASGTLPLIIGDTITEVGGDESTATVSTAVTLTSPKQLIRTSFPIIYETSGIRLVYSNMASGSQGGETPNANAITVKATIEYNNVLYPVSFNGLSSITIQPGELIESDLTLLSLPAGATLWTRTHVEVSPGQVVWANNRIAQSGAAVPGTDLWINGDGAEAYLTSGALGSPGSPGDFQGYIPICIKGVPAGGKPEVCVLGVGDSITRAYHDYLQGGFIQRACGSDFSHMNIATGGETGQSFNKNCGMRSKFTQGFTHAICAYGVNDVAGGANLATVQAALQAQWGWLHNLGMKVDGGTLLPLTSSTDLWITTVNQSIANATKEAQRLLVNEWLRTVPSPLVNLWDIASAVEADGGLWKAGVLAYTGTVTDTDATVYLKDTTKNWTTSELIFAVIKLTHANGDIEYRQITWNRATYAVIYPAWTAPATAGDTYIIYYTYTRDGIHPTPYGYEAMAAVIDSSAWRV